MRRSHPTAAAARRIGIVHGLAAVLALASAVAAPWPARAQINLVVPQTAGQNQVRWDKFDWKFVDLLRDRGVGAGVRLYYYEEERETAERAAAAVEEEYLWLVEQFDYKPTVRVPYILYNSHGELEQTNLFQIGESTLGVTSPEDLKMTAAYWGDHARFRHVSLHEMVHQFTIQKVNGIAEKAKAYGTPLQKLPLWFIEGLAEYYSTPGGLDAEAEQYLRDLIANPDPYRGYGLPTFLSDDLRSFLYTYKLGQGRVYFLAETYGKAKLQEILSTSYRLRGWRRTSGPEGVEPGPGASGRRGDRVLEFDELLERVTGDSMEKIQGRWEDWLKRRYFRQYLSATQEFSDFREVEAARAHPDSFVVSPDGHALVYRGIEPVTGKSRLYLVDPRDPMSQAEIVEDGRPGVDTLHYFDRPVVAIDDERIAYVARSGPGDVIRILRYRHSARDAEEGNRIHTRARFRVGGARETFDPRGERIREIGSPVFSPDGKRLAFVGLDDTGVSDLWVLELATSRYRRITHDLHAEKEIDWGKAGIVYSADATESRRYNLFLVDPDDPTPRRITQADANHRYPRFTPEGDRIGFSGDDAGKWDVYFLSVAAAVDRARAFAPAPSGAPPSPGAVEASGAGAATVVALSGGGATTIALRATSAVSAGADADGFGAAPKETGYARATDFPTGLTYPFFTARRMLALGIKSGRFRVFSIDRGDLQNEPLPYPAIAPWTPWQIPHRPLERPREYSVLRADSWQLEQAFASLGGGSMGVVGAGFLLFNDRMRDRTVYVVAEARGRPDLTDAQAIYFDRSRRVPWGIAAFLRPTWIVDPEFSDANRAIYVLERKFGGAAILELPFNRYFRIGASFGLAGTSRSIPSIAEDDSQNLGFGNDVTGRQAWERKNVGVEPEIDASVSVGFDTLIQSWETGPLSGDSVVATVSTYFQPTRGSWFGDVGVDAQHYLRLYKTVNLGLRAAWGQAFGDEWLRPFWVYSFYNLRGVPYYQIGYLVNEKYTLAQAELQVPLDGLIRLLIFQNIEGIAAIDAGSVFRRYDEFEENRTAAFVTGFNFNLAIFQFRLHFAKSFDIGGIKPGVPRPGDRFPVVPTGWVTNFSIQYVFF